MPEMTIQQAMQLAMQQHHAGQLQQPAEIYRQVLAVDGRNVDALRLLGALTFQLGQTDAGLALIRQAIAVRPGHAGAHLNLGDGLKQLGRLDDALREYQTAIDLQPADAEPRVRFALALQDRGQLVDAIAALRTAVSLSPGRSDLYHRLLLLLHCHPDADAKSIYEEHRQWNDPTPERRLRVGYISQDFCQQPLATFVLPLLANHDRRQVQIVGYGDVLKPDMLTDRIRALCDEWRFTTPMSDAQLAEQIITDRIDIMVDLSLHTTPNRLLALARKPAPVQVTYLGYCSTTGMDAIDYRLTDPYLDPPGPGDAFYSEKSIRLPESYWCYHPLMEVPLRQSPAVTNGFITFGCLNNFIKLSGPTLAMFCQLLKAVPDSRLILHAREGTHRLEFENQLRSEGIDPLRLQFVGYLPLHEYFNVYQQIDIALDPFPWGGGTTTLDALWVGIPVVTLRGRLAVGRGGVSILSNVGLSDLIANTEAEYERIAVDLARNIPRLRQLRTALRQAMQNSPLMNAPRFARNIELAYRQMWRNHCQNVYRQRQR
jgi:protein O-GlcNAc transferase